MKINLQKPSTSRNGKEVDVISWAEQSSEEIRNLAYARRRNASYQLIRVGNKYAFYTNAKLQRIFSDAEEARTFFQIKTQ